MKRPSILLASLCLALFLAAALHTPALAESWSQMNQLLKKSENWKQIVENPPFALGWKSERTAPDGLPYQEMAYGTYPRIDGSTVALPMAVEFARQHLDLGEADIRGFVSFSTTHAAYELLIGREATGTAVLVTEGAVMEERPVDVFLGTEPSREELALAEEKGVRLVKEPLCWDAFVFIVHKSNPVDSLTLGQIQGIYTGEIRTWAEVGGAPEEEIWPYQRNPGSGSQTAMENLVMQGKRMSGRGASGYYLNEMSDLVEAIGGNSDPSSYSIGYTFKYYIDRLYTSESIKVLAVDGVYPTEENVRGGAYPFSTHYYGVIRAGEEDGVAGRFLKWMVSEEGQKCIEQAGYIPWMRVGEE